MEYRKVQQVLRDLSNPDIAEHSGRFFKTGQGEYGEGDKFLGIRVPRIREVAKKFRELPLTEVEALLHSEYHEERLCALIVLVNKMKHTDTQEQKTIYELYLSNTEYVNNWDLVDTSAGQIVGRYLADKKDRSILQKLAKSQNLWKRRIAIMSTFHFIRNNEFSVTFEIAELLLDDEHDLIHKAVGWMLREVGNRNRPAETKFLKQHLSQMPRTMLRYAIEHFSDEDRKTFLAR